MPGINYVIREGKTVQEAVKKALRSLGINKDQAVIEVLSRGTQGFLGLGAKPAKVRVSVKAGVMEEFELKDVLVDLKLTETVRDPSLTGQAGPEQEIAAAEDRKVGMAEVKDGILVVTNPVNDDRHAVIRPDKRVRLVIHGEETDGESTVFAEDEIQVEIINDEPISSLELNVSEDNLQACLRLVKRPGFKYKLKDQAAANKLILITEVDEIVELPLPTPAEVKGFLQENGVVRGIKEEAIQQVLDNPNSKKGFLVAEGQEPVESVNAYIQYPFLEGSKDSKEEGLFERNKLVSVNPGEVVAIKVHKQPGRDGWTVTDQVIPAKDPEDCEIRVKKGCEIIDHGEQAIATISGRPMVETVGNKSFVYVDPIYVVQEVNQVTGDIYFSGDVEVKGNVRDGCMIEANGNIEVAGDVSRATISAGSSVVIHQMVLGSKIIAGGRSAIYATIKPFLGEISKILKRMAALAEQQKNAPGSLSRAGQPEDDGLLIQALIDSRFSYLPTIIDKLTGAVHNVEQLVHQDVLNLTNVLYRNFCGLGPLHISSIAAVKELRQAVKEMISYVDSSLHRSDNIKARYVQNCSLISSGDIFIEGEGCYISSLNAGGEVIITGKPGLARGVKIVAGGNITIQEAGSEFETRTQITCKGNGKISIDLVHPDVVIQIGQEEFRVDKASRKFTAYLNAEGRLSIDRLLADGKPAKGRKK